MGLTKDEAEAIAIVAAKTTMACWEDQRKKANERIVGAKAIASELGVTERHLWNLVRNKRFPLDREPSGGVSVARWELERWQQSWRTPVVLDDE